MIRQLFEFTCQSDAGTDLRCMERLFVETDDINIAAETARRAGWESPQPSVHMCSLHHVNIVALAAD